MYFAGVQSWVGKVTQIIPPNYGIVDGSAFYVTQCVKGSKQPAVRCHFQWIECLYMPAHTEAAHTAVVAAAGRPFVGTCMWIAHPWNVLPDALLQMGDQVRCSAIPNTDGGQYAWRCTEVEVRSRSGFSCKQCSMHLVHYQHAPEVLCCRRLRRTLACSRFFWRLS